MVSVIRPRQARIGQSDEPPGGDAVGDVGELVGPVVGEVGQGLVPQQLAVQLRHTVDLRAADGGQERHPDRPEGVLLDDRHPAHLELVIGVGQPQLLQELVVDPVDDLQMPRQQPAEHLDRPDLERLGQQSVAGVGEALAGDVPGLFPLDPTLVDQDPHQFGNGDHRVCVVELEDHSFGQLAQVEAGRQHVVQVVAQRTGHEEVLLLEAELLALRGRILGVEHLADVLGERLGTDRLQVVAAVEHVQVEGLGRLGAPQPKGVHAFRVVAGDHVVVRDADHFPAVLPAGARAAGFVLVLLGVSGEPHLDTHFRMRELPR